jgi:hypothetical protein
VTKEQEVLEEVAQSPRMETRQAVVMECSIYQNEREAGLGSTEQDDTRDNYETFTKLVKPQPMPHTQTMTGRDQGRTRNHTKLNKGERYNMRGDKRHNRPNNQHLHGVDPQNSRTSDGKPRRDQKSGSQDYKAREME